MDKDELIRALNNSKEAIHKSISDLPNCQELLQVVPNLDREKVQEGYSLVKSYAQTVCSLIDKAIDCVRAKKTDSFNDVKTQLEKKKSQIEGNVIPTGYTLFLQLISQQVNSVCQLHLT